MDVAHLQHTFYQKLTESFGRTPTSLQSVALQQLAKFLTDSHIEERIFLLKGYAGTGKTTLINAIVQSLDLLQMKSVLLAPTGRAAKVISGYTQKVATTIHKHIYFPKASAFKISFQLKKNKANQTLFIVDEASMLSDHYNETQNSLLTDLIDFVYQGKNCTLLLIGDTAQLPPVHSQSSPALQTEELERISGKKIIEIELNEVLRQSLNSGILHNATQIRVQLQNFSENHFKLQTRNFTDITPLNDRYDIQEAIHDSFQQNGIQQTNIIVRSNKRAVLYNEQIRNVILGYDQPLVINDLLMVVKNNYFWIKPSSEAGFIANGDIIQIQKIHQYQQIYGFNFAEVTVKMIDYPNQPAFTTILLLDTLSSQTPSLSYEENQKLYEEIKKDYQQESSSYRKYLKIKNNRFFNALQVKYSYATTCHKSQGGQWNTIFIEKPFLPQGVNPDYLRWIYTAITRAQKKIYLLGFNQDDFIS